MLVDRGDLAVYDQNQSQYLHSVPKIDKPLLKPGSYKNPKNLCFCLSVPFMYCRRKGLLSKLVMESFLFQANHRSVSLR